MQYLDAIVDDDVYRIDGVKRDTIKIRLLLRSLARNESTTVTNRSLKNDVKEKDDEDIDVDTIASYLDIFSRLFLIENQLPFATRSGLIGAGETGGEETFCRSFSRGGASRGDRGEAAGDLNTFGLLFEALCERDLRIYADAFGAQLFHYQDYQNREIDAVIQLPGGDWCAFEIKLGANQIDEAAASLVKLKNDIEREPGGIPPKILCVICGMSSAAYRREDGVYVVPVTALRE